MKGTFLIACCFLLLMNSANLFANIKIQPSSEDGVLQSSVPYKFYSKLAVKGNATAQNELGCMYRNGDEIPKNYKLAFEWFQKAAEQGDEMAQYNLGSMYRDGLGTTRDYKLAQERHLKAAEQGFSNAQNDLGVMYCEGWGVLKDYKLGYEWFAKAAAKQGYIDLPLN